MSSVREKRLQAELKAMRNFRSRVLTWKTQGNPNAPDTYILDYQLKSIVSMNNGNPVYDTGFQVSISFPRQYPRVKPDIKFVGKRPIHPNVYASGNICTEGDVQWIPGVGFPLDSLCTMIGQIIAYQEVNLGNPAYGNSALFTWIKKNLNFVNDTRVSNPVDPTQIRMADLGDALTFGTSNKSVSRSKPRISFG